MEWKKVKVIAYSGYKADERPVSFSMKGESLEIKRVTSEWRDPENDYFKVLIDDGRVYQLRRHRGIDQWFLLMSS